jgi:hypothetical protein
MHYRSLGGFHPLFSGSSGAGLGSGSLGVSLGSGFSCSCSCALTSELSIFNMLLFTFCSRWHSSTILRIFKPKSYEEKEVKRFWGGV